MAYLLVSPKRHLPCREPNKKNSILFHEMRSVRKKRILHFGLDMFNHIMQQNNIKLLVLILRNAYSLKIRNGKRTITSSIGKESNCIVDSCTINVNPRDLAAYLCKW